MKMEYDVLEREYVAEQTATGHWERNQSEREIEIQKKRSELEALRQKLGEWEIRFSGSAVNIVVSNGIVIKRILKN